MYQGLTVASEINERLAVLESKAEHTDKTLDRQTIILENVQKVLTEQAVANEKLVRVHERLDHHKSQIDKIALQVETNKATLAKWGGVVLVISTLAAWFGRDLLGLLV